MGRKLSFLLLLFIGACAGIKENPLLGLIRENPITKDIELATKVYVDKSSGISIKLLPMLHAGEPDYYDYINEQLRGHVVLYESLGQTWDIEKSNKKKLALLGEPYLDLYRLMHEALYAYRRVAKEFGLAIQDQIVDYDLAQEAVHADVLSDEDKWSDDREKLKGHLNEFARRITGELVKNSPRKEKILRALHNYVDSNSYATQYGALKIAVDIHLDEMPNTLREALGYHKTSPDDPQLLHDETYEKIVKPRDKILIAKISELLSRPDPPKKFVVAYGYLHMAAVEKFLMNHGFSLDESSVHWVTAIKNIDRKVCRSSRCL